MTPGPRRIGLLALGAAAAAWEVQRRIDKARIAADPERERLDAPLAGRRVPVVSDDGTELHAEVFGPEEAPTVVLVHGWMETLRFWTNQIQELSRGLRVVAFDLRGHGRSAAPVGRDYSTDAFAGDLGAVLRGCVPAGERTVVAGHSLGAMTLVAWAGNEPGEVERRLAAAALINTGLGDLITESLVLQAPGGLDRVHQQVGRLVLSAPVPIPTSPTPISSRVLRHLVLGPEATPAQVAFCERMLLKTRREVRAAAGATLSKLDLMESVASLDVPTAVVAGERDRLTPPSHAKRLAEALPRLAAHVELPGIGHMAPVEAPRAVSERIAELAGKRPAGEARRDGSRPAAAPEAPSAPAPGLSA